MKIAKDIKDIKEEVEVYKQLSDCLENRISYCVESVYDFFETIRCNLYTKLQEVINELEYIFDEDKIEEMKKEIYEYNKTEKCPFLSTFGECDIILDFIKKR